MWLSVQPRCVFIFFLFLLWRVAHQSIDSRSSMVASCPPRWDVFMVTLAIDMGD